ncbi:N-formylglutamate amidohydrolase [Croceicoccus mobilis]|uniref:N-formylglutamate amidohydrolase n=1 Tax=Croceicoccus mobilis TaxID=1703339 RepID=A0A917DZY5_9SPHN|nr:N-formylglutamate amidohydrolase [Croceicoccus mobilis]
MKIVNDPNFRQIGEPVPGGIVLVSDHASNFVPEDIPLGVTQDQLNDHIGWDIGVAAIAERMARRHAIPAHLAAVSRLVVDLHREEDHAKLIPQDSDGVLIPGNLGADREWRLERFYRPYHDAMAAWLDAAQPGLIVSLHSFTPQLADNPDEQRPWEVGLLYNEQGEAARHAIRLFQEYGLTVGDNEPYSGKLLNATMNRHAEAHGRPYLAIEVRNDLIRDEGGQARWADMIASVARGVRELV